MNLRKRGSGMAPSAGSVKGLALAFFDQASISWDFFTTSPATCSALPLSHQAAPPTATTATIPANTTAMAHPIAIFAPVDIRGILDGDLRGVRDARHLHEPDLAIGRSRR